MQRLRLILLLLLAASGALHAQTTRVRGSVRDADTGESIPFASIYFDGTTIGITSDLEGNYSLETRVQEAQVLTAQLLGYEPQSFTIVPGSYSEVHFRLKKTDNRLTAAIVRPDNRYLRSILRKIDESRDRNNPEKTIDWEAGLYSKIELDATDAEELVQSGLLKKSLGFVLAFRDTSAITGKSFIPIMISENRSRKYHSLHPAFDREVMESSRISGLDQDNVMRQFTGTYLLKTNFYDREIGVFNLTVPSPAAASSQLYYNYFLVDSLQVEGRKTYVLRFHPKKLVTSPVLDGEMQVDAEDFGIRSVHASLAGESNVNWIRHINVDITNRRLPDGHWFFDEERLFIDFSISNSDHSRIVSFLGNRQLKYDPPVIGPVTDPAVLSSDDPVIVWKSEEKDEAYWDSVRPYALSARERGIYDMVGILQEKPAYKWVYGIANMLITGYAESEKLGLGYGPWARTLTFNDIEGVRVQAGFRTTKEFSEHVRLSGSLAYGFKDEAFKWRAQTEFIFNREKTRKLTLTGKKDFVQLGRGNGVFTEPNIFNSLLARSSADKQTMMREFIIRYDHEWNNSFNNSLDTRTMKFWGNDDIPLIRQDGTLQEAFSIHQIHYMARFSWKERVNRGWFDKSYIFTRYPIVTVDLLTGIRGITDDDYAFTRGELSVDWRTPAGALGFGSIHVNGGAILGSVPYPMLKLHSGNKTYFLDKTAFSCMDYYEFASDRWVEAFYEHNLDGFFLGKIPLIKKLDLREVLSARAAWGTISAENSGPKAPFLLPEGIGTLQTPYVEVGVGVCNIFRLFRVDCLWRLTHRTDRNFAVNIALDLDF